MTTKRRWLPIVGGIAILLVFLGIGAVIVSVSWVREHLDVAPSSSTAATRAFDDIRARFPNRRPLIEMRNGHAESSGEPLPGGASASSISAVHALAWNPRDERLARFELPFWLLRLKSTPIQFGAYASGLEESGVRLRAEDIERYGPGIIADLALDDGVRVIVWAD